MPQEYIENARRWAEKVEIDYFTQFIKAWIPFNAWFQNAFEEDKERQIINALKSGANNPLRGRIVRLLQQADEEAAEFKTYLARLHYHLERHDLRNRGERLTFTHCFLGDNTYNQVIERGWRGATYTVERGIGRALQQNQKQSNVFCEIITNRGNVKYTKLQARYNRSEIEEDDTFRALSFEEQNDLLSRYDRVNPRLMINLLDRKHNRIPVGLNRPNGQNAIDIGTYQFCDNPEYIFAGLVEVLYGLRCMLFHGELTPTAEMNEVYEPAYFILRRFLRAIA